jgi:hypothetical protein
MQPGGRASGWQYTLHGLSVRSQVYLPLPPRVVAAPEPEVTIEVSQSTEPTPPPDGVPTDAYCSDASHAGAASSRTWRDGDGAWIWHQAVGTLHVSADARHIRVHARQGCDPAALRAQLLGPAAGLVLHHLGYPSLHASAIVSSAGAIAFMGWHGDGKSTIAAIHVVAGARLLGDDVLPIELRDGDIFARPGLPPVKRGPSSALGVGGLVLSPTRLKAVYVLNRYDPIQSGCRVVTSNALTPRLALTVLLTHTCGREYLLPEETARLLPVYGRLAASVPVRVLNYPVGFQYQDAVREHIRLDNEVQAARAAVAR